MTNAPVSISRALLDQVPAPPLPGLISAFLFRPGPRRRSFRSTGRRRSSLTAGCGSTSILPTPAPARSCAPSRTFPLRPSKSSLPPASTTAPRHGRLPLWRPCRSCSRARRRDRRPRPAPLRPDGENAYHRAASQPERHRGHAKGDTRRARDSTVARCSKRSWIASSTPSTTSPTAIPPRSTASRRESSPTKLTKAGLSSAACGGTACVCTGKSPFCVP